MRLSSTSTSVTSKSLTTSSGGGGGAATCTWSMRYHMFGGQQSWQLLVYVVDASNNATNILAKSGPQHTSYSDEWDLFEYDLMPSFAGQNVKILIVHGSANGTGNAYEADTAVDAMEVVTNGTSVNYSAQGASQKWESSNVGRSIANTLANTSYSTISTSGTKRWLVEPGHNTPSNNTGPDNAYDNNPNTDYFYFESSSTVSYYFYPLRMVNSFAVPS